MRVELKARKNQSKLSWCCLHHSRDSYPRHPRHGNLKKKRASSRFLYGNFTWNFSKAVPMLKIGQLWTLRADHSQRQMSDCFCFTNLWTQLAHLTLVIFRTDGGWVRSLAKLQKMVNGTFMERSSINWSSQFTKLPSRTGYGEKDESSAIFHWHIRCS